MNTPRHHKRGLLAAVSVAYPAMLIGSGLSTPSAQAGYIVTLEQVGSNVVAIGSGTIDLAGLNFLVAPPADAATIALWPSFPYLATGPTSSQPIDVYSGFTGPASFGGGGFTFADSGTGDTVGIQGAQGNYLFVPRGYVSEMPLSDTSTYLNQSFASLGVTPGTYEWTWGSGPTADTFTIDVSNLPAFAGMPGQANCQGQSFSSFSQQFGGLNKAASVLGFSSVSALQSAVSGYCAGSSLAALTQIATDPGTDPMLASMAGDPPGPGTDPIPEPASIALLGAGLACFAAAHKSVSVLAISMAHQRARCCGAA
jgi:hypothetical protein